MNNKNKVYEQVIRASKDWIACFNAGNARGCSERYSEKAIMHARPMGSFTGRANIYAFWQELISSGAKELQYDDIEVNVIDDKNALLSASWSMNIGSGYISKELWRFGENGWQLEEDDFTLANKVEQ